MSILTLIDEFNSKIENTVESLPRVSASKIGLDVRAGYVYVDLDDMTIIAHRHNIRSLDYYGGFEYVEDHATQSVGDYKVYMGYESERVMSALEYFEEHMEEEVA